jgi:hypothetical protein
LPALHQVAAQQRGENKAYQDLDPGIHHVSPLSLSSAKIP